MTVEEFIRQLEKVYREQDYRATLDFMTPYADEMRGKMNQDQCEYVFGEIGEYCVMLMLADEYEQAQAEGRPSIYDTPTDELAPAANEPSE